MTELERWSHHFQLALDELPPDSECVPARVISQHRGAYGLITEAGEATGVAPGRMFFRATGLRAMPAVGDWVRVRPSSDGPAVIEEILPRRTEFVRRRAGTESGEQVVATNIDVAFVVSSLNQELSPRRLERYLVATRESGAEPVVVLSKADLVDDPGPALDVVRQVAGDAPVVTFSSFSEGGLEGLEPWLRPGRTVVLLGSSGVGKSTLVNRLSGRELPTQDIRAADDAGRHTTTHREIFLLPTGALMLDTPGMRELGLVEADDGLQESFDDIEALLSGCRFRDCKHEAEPGCAVIAARDSGELPAERWASYLKLQKEVHFQKRRTDPVAERAEQARWKAIHKEFRKALKKGDERR